MNISTRRAVEDLPTQERRSLESLLGQKLETDQEVFVFACSPGVLPDDHARQEAGKRIESTLLEAHDAAETRGVNSAEADQAVDEVTNPERRRA